jgi:hypothetical protein
MNRDVAHRYLSEYRALVAEASRQPMLSKERRAALKAANEHLPTVNALLRALAPDLPLINAHWLNDHVAAGPRLQCALDLLSDWQEMDTHLVRRGPGAAPESSRSRDP